MAGTGGAGTWGTGSYDPDLNLLYWTTGNPAPDYNGHNRDGRQSLLGLAACYRSRCGKDEMVLPVYAARHA